MSTTPDLTVLLELDDLRLRRTDRYNINLEERKVNKKTGEPYWSARYHYGSVKDALRDIIRELANDEPGTISLEQYVERIEQAERKVSRLMEDSA